MTRPSTPRDANDRSGRYTNKPRWSPWRCLDSQDTGRGLLHLPVSLGAPRLLMQTPQSLSRDLWTQVWTSSSSLGDPSSGARRVAVSDGTAAGGDSGRQERGAEESLCSGVRSLSSLPPCPGTPIAARAPWAASSSFIQGEAGVRPRFLELRFHQVPARPLRAQFHQR